MLAPGGQPVIDENHRLAGHVDGRAAAAVGGLAPDQFPAFAFGDIAQLLRCDAQRAQHVVVDHDASTAGQCAHGELFVTGRAELAHDERIQRSAEGRSHFPCDGNSAAGQTQDDDAFASAVCAEQIGQDAAGFTAVTKDCASGRSSISPARESLLLRPAGGCAVRQCRDVTGSMGDAFDVVRGYRHHLDGRIG